MPADFFGRYPAYARSGPVINALMPSKVSLLVQVASGGWIPTAPGHPGPAALLHVADAHRTASMAIPLS
jgi:hypothetical protein